MKKNGGVNRPRWDRKKKNRPRKGTVTVPSPRAVFRLVCHSLAALIRRNRVRVQRNSFWDRRNPRIPADTDRAGKTDSRSRRRF